MLIFMSDLFVQYLNRAASGQIPGMIIIKLMMLEMPNLMGLLLPLGFYMAILIAYGRLYAESEMPVLQACGYGPSQLLKHTLIMAFMVFGVVTILMIWVSPIVNNERSTLLRTSGMQTLVKLIVPGRFRAEAGGKEVFYVEAMNRNHTRAKNVFLRSSCNKKQYPTMGYLVGGACLC